MHPQALPRGIWYEAAKNRYRVRKYRNRIPYLVGYYYSLDEAKAALNNLDDKLAKTPKQRTRHAAPPIPCANFRSTAASLADDHQRDPSTFRRNLH